VHPNVKKVFDYYAQKGMVQVRSVSYPSGQPNIPGFQPDYHRIENDTVKSELTALNDCTQKKILTTKVNSSISQIFRKFDCSSQII
jgi:hypothetical protein